MLWRGALAVLIGVITIIWPSITVGAIVLLFAVYAFADAVGQVGRAFASDAAGPVVGHLLLGGLDVAAGVVAVAWPGITAYALTVWIGIWALITGAVEVAAGFAVPAGGATRTALVFAGIVSVLFGVVVVAHPDAGALSLALVFGLFSLVYGMNLLFVGGRLHRETRSSRP
jgi:uncharacterized membrane protein HdeD (DUF308 family)